MTRARSHAPEAGGAASRVRVFDVVRGLSVLSMVAFHLCYDLTSLAHARLDWFEPPLQDVWRASISWTFVFVAGCMCAWSRDNLRRSLRYLAAALAIFVATTLAKVDTPISFGVIFCMGACTLIVWALSSLGLEPRGGTWAALFALLFLATLDLGGGSVRLGVVSVRLPAALYSTPWLSWLGFPGPGFASGDYYPVLPYLFLYLCGSSLGRAWRRDGMPPWCHPVGVPALEWVGRRALPIYLLHQPLLLLVVELLP